jgi:carboxylesterase type B
MSGCAKTFEMRFAEMLALRRDKKKTVLRTKKTEKIVLAISRLAASKPIIVACD